MSHSVTFILQEKMLLLGNIYIRYIVLFNILRIFVIGYWQTHFYFFKRKHSEKSPHKKNMRAFFDQHFTLLTIVLPEGQTPLRSRFAIFR